MVIASKVMFLFTLKIEGLSSYIEDCILKLFQDFCGYINCLTEFVFFLCWDFLCMLHLSTNSKCNLYKCESRVTVDFSGLNLVSFLLRKLTVDIIWCMCLNCPHKNNVDGRQDCPFCFLISTTNQNKVVFITCWSLYYSKHFSGLMVLSWVSMLVWGVKPFQKLEFFFGGIFEMLGAALLIAASICHRIENGMGRNLLWLKRERRCVSEIVYAVSPVACEQGVVVVCFGG